MEKEKVIRFMDNEVKDTPKGIYINGIKAPNEYVVPMYDGEWKTVFIGGAVHFSNQGNLIMIVNKRVFVNGYELFDKAKKRLPSKHKNDGGVHK